MCFFIACNFFWNGNKFLVNYGIPACKLSYHAKQWPGIEKYIRKKLTFLHGFNHRKSYGLIWTIRICIGYYCQSLSAQNLLSVAYVECSSHAKKVKTESKLKLQRHDKRLQRFFPLLWVEQQQQQKSCWADSRNFFFRQHNLKKNWWLWLFSATPDRCLLNWVNDLSHTEFTFMIVAMRLFTKCRCETWFNVTVTAANHKLKKIYIYYFLE